MAKRINIYEPIGDGSRNRGETRYVLSLKKDRLCKETGMGRIVEEYPLSKIRFLDCYQTGAVRQGDVAGGAAVGFLLGGLTGAAVGGLLNSGSNPVWCLEITLEDRVVNYKLNTNEDRNTVVKWADRNGLKPPPPLL